MRFAKGEVSSVFDFEALVAGTEPVLVGQAAVQFINEPSGVRDPATAAVHFIKAYEAARGRFNSLPGWPIYGPAGVRTGSQITSAAPVPMFCVFGVYPFALASSL